MALSKREILQGGVSNQEALVKRLQEQRAVPPRKRVIPGGKTMLETLDQERLESAIYNWLRGCRAFSQVTISLAKDPEKFSTRTQRVREFDTKGREVWETHPEGKLHLARQLADVLNTYKVVKVVAKKDGIWIHTDTNETFAPVSIATEQDVVERMKLIQEVVQEALDAGEEPEDYSGFQLSIGDEMPSPDWEPFIEFIPKRKQEYGR